MNPITLGAHFNASRGLRAPFNFARRKLHGRQLTDTSSSRAVLGKTTSCSQPTLLLPAAGRQQSHLLQEKCTLHCTRRIHNNPTNGSSSSSSSSSSASPTFRERIANLKRNGTPELAFGFLLLTLAGIDYFLQERNDAERDDMYRQLEREVRRDEATTRREDKDMLSKGGAMNPLFQCTIRKAPMNFDGHKCLKNVRVGDVVGVIEEGVGPDGQYNLCSIVRKSNTTAKKNNNGGEDDDGNDSSENISIGWFPCSCLEKIE
mmetsp:Transcript_29400/g.53942  ORF Transcript_29400/g.53942 Transcript_29400/m.53942 type:complete len:261 (-) Transcript_29400:835-1617(-)|eukprot:CAMPEP_0201655150 /NCGR_PEP_ID=MMETSP0493-20130528/45863_1 /ASSEMBLY_ACC=CAM_ASM_000838 /TAXON_ID=420259 /ORGANISM="Thalassiosira gravida, Strain GMp14c1" /LENGTH=260 /DNA_ID=CAMNT_0048131727 /DNA_START=164 /DNA_END=946 /DNA_ORIENTATION=+